MLRKLKQTASYLTIIALFNASCAPLYAQGGKKQAEDEGIYERSSLTRQSPPKASGFEERGQQILLSAFDKLWNWIPQRVKSSLSQLAEDVVPLVNGKTPLELDYSDLGMHLTPQAAPHMQLSPLGINCR